MISYDFEVPASISIVLSLGDTSNMLSPCPTSKKYACISLTTGGSEAIGLGVVFETVGKGLPSIALIPQPDEVIRITKTNTTKNRALRLVVIFNYLNSFFFCLFCACKRLFDQLN
jgi:hypothetical protein